MALAGEFESDPADPLDLVGIVDLGVDAALLAIAEIDDLLRLAEIDAARQFAHDDEVETLDDLALQGRGIGECRIADGRPQIGEQGEILAQPQEPRLGPHVVRDSVPFGAADSAEDHRVGRLSARHVLLADRLAMRIIGAAADEALLRLETGQSGSVAPGDDFFDLGHHFGADAVTGQEEQLVGRHGISCPLDVGRVAGRGDC